MNNTLKNILRETFRTSDTDLIFDIMASLGNHEQSIFIKRQSHADIYTWQNEFLSMLNY